MSQSPLTGKRICVTGGSGFLGSYLLDALKDRGCGKVFIARHKDYDLVTQEGVRRMYEDACPDVVLHLAAVVGGIGANRENPGRFFYENLMMGAQLMEHARLTGVGKFVAVGTICAYPKNTPVPFKEDDLWDGYPEETNAPYGLAKKMLLVQAQAYRQQYDFNAIYLLPVNLYGPRDNFNPASSHVIPALVRKVAEAQASKAEEIVCWGTGRATREFLYAGDCAEAILRAAESYDGYEPLNIGTGREISIRELVELICSLMDYKGKVTWDATKPDGQPRRCLDVSRIKRELDWTAAMSLEAGLKRTIDWYRAETGFRK